MGQAKYVYTFVQSGKLPEMQPQAGMKRAACIDNAKEAAKREGHTQDIYRMPVPDAQGHTPAGKPCEWEFVNTVGKKPEAQISKETATAQECVRCIEAAMPNELAVTRAPVIKWRREGMKEAVQAIKRQFNIS